MVSEKIIFIALKPIFNGVRLCLFCNFFIKTEKIIFLATAAFFVGIVIGLPGNEVSDKSLPAIHSGPVSEHQDRKVPPLW